MRGGSLLQKNRANMVVLLPSIKSGKSGGHKPVIWADMGSGFLLNTLKKCGHAKKKTAE